MAWFSYLEKPDFQKEISCQLYGFGDAKNPYKETVGKWPLSWVFSKINFLQRIGRKVSGRLHYGYDASGTWNRQTEQNHTWRYYLRYSKR